MEIGGIPPQSSSVGAVRAAAPIAFAEGAQYQALILNRDGDTVEILIGNRTLFAKTALDLAPGRLLTLLLAEARPDMFLFRVLEGAGEGVLRVPIDTETLLTRLGVPVTRQTIDIATLLNAQGITVNAHAMALFMRLAESGSTHLRILAIIYSSLLSEGVNPDFATLAALASYVSTEPAMGALIDRLRKAKNRDRVARRNDLLNALVYIPSEGDPKSIEDIAAFLYTPAEAAIGRAVSAPPRADRDAMTARAAVGGAAIALAASEKTSDETAAELVSAEMPKPLDSQSAEGASIDVETAHIEALLRAHIEAVNILNALSDTGFLAEMPIQIGDDVATVVLKTHREDSVRYDEAITLLMTLKTKRLGAIEVYIRKQGTSLAIEFYADDDTTLALLALNASQLEFERRLGEATRIAHTNVQFARLARALVALE